MSLNCLSNVSISKPTCPFSRNPTSNQLHSRSHHKIGHKIRVQALPAEGRDNLDHLQRSNNQLNQQTRKRSSVPVTSIGLWDRFPNARTLQQMLDTMDRIIDNPSAYNRAWPSALAQSYSGSYTRGRTPWDIKETESEYKLRFDMPGMTKKDVKVWVEEKMLVVKAEKVPEEGEENGDDWSAKSYGRYSSRIGLPERVEFEKIRAQVNDGVLYVSVPKERGGAKVWDVNVQ